MSVNWVAFIGVVMLAYLIPGPDFAFILRSATRGPRAGASAALGAQVGLCVHTLLAVVGLSVVLARHPGLLTAVRLVGGAYLLYLGGRLIVPTLRRARQHGAQQAAPSEPVSTRSTFVQGLLINLLNPKAVLFFAAVLPQFVAAGSTTPVWVQIAALGVVDVALGFVAWTLVVLLGVRLAAVLRQPRAQRWWDRITGSALGGLGGAMALSRS